MRYLAQYRTAEWLPPDLDPATAVERERVAFIERVHDHGQGLDSIALATLHRLPAIYPSAFMQRMGA
jgi:hypothetical protein